MLGYFIDNGNLRTLVNIPWDFASMLGFVIDNGTWDWRPLSCEHTLRCMGVIWFVFHVLDFLPIRFTKQNSCSISKSTMKHLQIPGGKRTCP